MCEGSRTVCFARSARADATHYGVARTYAFAGSLAVHGAIALVAALVARWPDRGEPPPRPRTVEIELVGPLPAPPSPHAPANAGGAPPSSAPSPRAPANAAGAPPSSAPSPRAHSRHLQSASAGRAPRREPSPVRAIAPPAPRRSALADEVTMRIEPPSAGAGDASGDRDDELGDASGGRAGGPVDASGRAGGLGDGTGRGIGFGAGRGDSDAALAAFAVPTPDIVPRPSQARPPHLIYPRRNRDVDESRLFVARLTIDTDGFVVGAQLVGGRGERGADRAANAVWRFRYRPALDSAGRPVTVTIDQRFLVDD
jgi:hypothetical protein